MEELCNLHGDYNSNLRDLTHIQVKESYDPNELKEYNKRNLTRVTPYFTEEKRKKTLIFILHTISDASLYV